MLAARKKMIVVRGFPRLHVTLLDLGNATPRRYGGGGFMLDCLPIEARAWSAPLGGHTEDDLTALDPRGREDVAAALARLRAVRDLGRSTVAVRQLPPQHIGLGSKTATVLAALRACAAAGGWNVPRYVLQRLSGRGGASGVGVHGFFSGGFVVDGGHNTLASVGYSPSSGGPPDRVPPLCARLSIPAHWRFHLFLPTGNRVSGADEGQFLRENAPIPVDEAYAAMGSMYHGVIPAVVEQSIAELSDGLRSIHRSGFKFRELKAQPENVRALYRALSELKGLAVGMSSMGPLIYAIAESSSLEIEDDLRRIARLHGAERIAVASPRNRGYEMVESDAD